MPKSTQIITDSGLLASGGFTAASFTKAIAAAGPIQDLKGNGGLILLKYQEALYLLGQLKNGVDGSDPLLTQIQALIDVSV